MDLQQLYNSAIRNEHWVFSDWAVSFNKFTALYIKEAKSHSDGAWADDAFKLLVYSGTNQGVSNLRQGGLNYDEYSKLQNNWQFISNDIQDALFNGLTEKLYYSIEKEIQKYCSQKRPAAIHRIIAGLFPGIVTTTVSDKHWNSLVNNMQHFFADYPVPKWRWYEDNIAFVDYCKQHVNFKEESHVSIFAWFLIECVFGVMNANVNFLKTNKNIILHGAPGTGKTYSARELAIFLITGKDESSLSEDEKKTCRAHMGFVQFHPSYDYTDFVEGLRPCSGDDGSVGFELKDGIFKEFCCKALEGNSKDKGNFSEIYDKFINDIIEVGGLELKTLKQNASFRVDINTKHNVNIYTERTRMVVTKEMIQTYLETEVILDWKPYTTAIADYIKKTYPELQIESKQSAQYSDYVFIIDEINRGDMSKIFGELFFSIDPDYRGVKGRVKTQYANAARQQNAFDRVLFGANSDETNYGYFFVPDNVYIIGTMNDIDRSVESMDFAMRRRFSFVEITAEESAASMDIPYGPNDCMRKLNEALTDPNVGGLTSDYEIGASYFHGVNLSNTDEKDALWINKIHGLVKEYLRGTGREDKIGEIARAYGYSKA